MSFSSTRDQGCPSNPKTRPTRRFRPYPTRKPADPIKSPVGDGSFVPKNRLRRVGLGFPPQNPKKPDPTDVLRFSSKNFQNPAEISRIRRYVPDSSDIFQIPASNFQIPASNFQILATNFHISATYQVDLVIFRPNLGKSHRIQRELTRSGQISAGFGVFLLKSTILAGFFTVDGSDRTYRVSGPKPTAPIRLPRRSAAGQDFFNPIISSRSRVGHKPDPDRPVNTPTHVEYLRPHLHFELIELDIIFD